MGWRCRLSALLHGILWSLNGTNTAVMPPLAFEALRLRSTALAHMALSQANVASSGLPQYHLAFLGVVNFVQLLE